MRSLLLFLTLAALAVSLGGSASAQPAGEPLGGEPLVWERVGTVEKADWLAFDADTLYAGIGNISGGRQESAIVSLRPGDDDWSVVEMWDWYTHFDDLYFDADRTLFAYRLGSIMRFEAWGGDGAEVNDDAYTVPHRTPSGALVVGINKQPFLAARSTDGGRTWTDHGSPEVPTGMTPVAIVSFPPSPDAPEGRLVPVGGEIPRRPKASAWLSGHSTARRSWRFTSSRPPISDQATASTGITWPRPTDAGATLSAATKSAIDTTALPETPAASSAAATRAAAVSAASRAIAMRSALEQPLVRLATSSRSTSSARGIRSQHRSSVCRRSFAWGSPSGTSHSKRPGRRSAGSMSCGRLVAATTRTPRRGWMPSSSVSSWVTASACSCDAR